MLELLFDGTNMVPTFTPYRNAVKTGKLSLSSNGPFGLLVLVQFRDKCGGFLVAGFARIQGRSDRNSGESRYGTNSLRDSRRQKRWPPETGSLDKGQDPIDFTSR